MLAWHVDYWDHLGWKDPFGSKRFTLRQRRYKKALGMRVIGTPYFHVDNRNVGGSRIAAAVEKGAKLPARIGIEAAAELAAGKVRVVAKLRKLDAGLKLPETAGVFAVLYRRTATTECRAGENRGRTLAEHFVVLAAGEPAKFQGKLEQELAAPKGVKAEDLGVAILVEDGAAMRTIECTDVPVRSG